MERLLSSSVLFTNRRMLVKLSAVLLLCGYAASFQYEGYKVYDVQPKTAVEAEFLFQLSKQGGYDGLHIPRILDRSAQVMVAPEQQEEFRELLDERHIEYKVLVEDVAQKLEEDGIAKQSARGRSGRLGFTQYYRHADINAYLEELAAQYPGYVAVENVGTSFEGRPLKTIRITNGGGNPNKQVIFVDAGIHAREWIAPATALYIIHQLAENRAANENLLANFDWVVLPVVNPDGYEYSHTNSRMWRKTRSRGTLCYGTDGNRNFDFHWGEVGASSLDCSETYRGKNAFSEVETQVVRDILLSLKGRGVFYLTLHSYGNYLLYPWGWTSNLPPTVDDLDEVAVAGYHAIVAATGTKYTYGSSTRVLYAAAGGSDDFAYAVAEFPISITMELPAGGSGFDPKPSQIQGFASEAWVGIKAMAEKVEEKYAS